MSKRRPSSPSPSEQPSGLQRNPRRVDDRLSTARSTALGGENLVAEARSIASGLPTVDRSITEPAPSFTSLLLRGYQAAQEHPRAEPIILPERLPKIATMLGEKIVGAILAEPGNDREFHNPGPETQDPAATDRTKPPEVHQAGLSSPPTGCNPLAPPHPQEDGSHARPTEDRTSGLVHAEARAKMAQVCWQHVSDPLGEESTNQDRGSQAPEDQGEAFPRKPGPEVLETVPTAGVLVENRLPRRDPFAPLASLFLRREIEKAFPASEMGIRDRDRSMLPDEAGFPSEDSRQRLAGRWHPSITQLTNEGLPRNTLENVSETRPESDGLEPDSGTRNASHRVSKLSQRPSLSTLLGPGYKEIFESHSATGERGYGFDPPALDPSSEYGEHRIDLSRTNDLLRQLIDAVQRGRSPFLPARSRPVYAER
jgi:hypothetical protein